VVAGVAVTWAVAGWQAVPALYLPGWTAISIFDAMVFAAVRMILCWLLIALAVMDAEDRWLPDWFTLGGAVLGAVFSLGRFAVYSMWKGIPLHWSADTSYVSHRQHLYEAVLHWIFGILAVPGIVWLARWIYERIRRQEGAKAGEAKLMLLLAAWLGLSHTLLAFVIGILLAGIALLTIAVRKGQGIGLNAGLPVASFLCVGGIVSGLWGRQMIDAYLRWSDFL
jgi:leader peptidase (prepilin peptidase) / N-methyltransferase